ncbi:MAG TPA: tRNA (N(6)-L-threonylcarbamoyladenosine(37)-C(2))-methylthiotransferase MtaB [Desulfosalsimonadaceae bacterium]|nr:tRNA (N(6)-L-threonylcarbamoyladenosine(37)-C(2))-methylthiotransferase MtaB [Desulfosalsimonadaceae bacterium]
MDKAGIFKYRVVTLGCRVNQYESESIAASLESEGWQRAGDEEESDLWIINTCAVTAKAAMQSRQAVRHAVREFPDTTVLVTGCYVQSDPQVFAQMPGVGYVIGNADKHRIHEIIADMRTNRPKHTYLICNPIRKFHEFPPSALPSVGARARPYLKIQDGCDDFCTYCIVPYTRGTSRSLSPEAVIERISILAANGAEEVVLTGIHLGRYGLDLSPPITLFSLLRRIDAAETINRVRLSSIEPKELSTEIIQMAAETPRICRHFHIPLQSGDKDILAKMKRPYDPDFFTNLVWRIHERIDDAAIGVDVLAGFPGEDENAFANTYNLLASLPITYLHVFPFSPRPQTPAGRYANPVDPKVIKKRCALLRQLSQDKKMAFYQKQIGRVTDVILEGKPDTVSGRFKGISENYLQVFTQAPKNYRNKWIKCRLTGPVVPKGIIGEMID